MKKRIIKDINEDFFCDGPYYFLTSSSLGGSNLTTDEISNNLLQNELGVKKILSEGIGLPLFFLGDCALDGTTRFVIGELSEKEEKNWIGKITSKLKIPCGKVVLCSGGGDSESLAYSISGKTPEENYIFFETLDIPSGNYLVEVFCYIDSMTFNVEFEDFSENANEENISELGMKYKEKFEDIGLGYIIRFSELKKEPELPKLVDEISWCGIFDYREL